MTRISGYSQARELILEHIYTTKCSSLDRASAASLLKVSITAAGNYLNVLATELPNALKYSRGVLLIFQEMPEQALPLTVRMEAKHKHAETAKQMIRDLLKDHAIFSKPKLVKEELSKILKTLEPL